MTNVKKGGFAATVVTHFDKFQVSPSGMLLQLFLNPIGELSLCMRYNVLPSQTSMFAHAHKYVTNACMLQHYKTY